MRILTLSGLRLWWVHQWRPGATQPVHHTCEAQFQDGADVIFTAAGVQAWRAGSCAYARPVCHRIDTNQTGLVYGRIAVNALTGSQHRT